MEAYVSGYEGYIGVRDGVGVRKARVEPGLLPLIGGLCAVRSCQRSIEESHSVRKRTDLSDDP